MTIREIIKKHEGLRLKAYPDPATKSDPWTIGYGHTRNVKRGDVITEEQAEKFLDEDMAEAYACVDSLVKVPLHYHQRDALCSFVFNLGCTKLKNSTLLKKLNKKDYVGAANEFTRWVYGAGVVMPGLVKRRKEEKALFLSGTNLPTESFVKEEPVAPFAAAILTQAIPALIGKLPEIAQIFKNPDVRERNVEAVAKVGQILIESTGSTNVQEAVEKVQADPEVAAVANEALRLNRAEVMDLVERMAKLEDTRVEKAREFYQGEKPVIGKWKYVHILSTILILFGGVAAGWVLGTSEDPAERAMALQTLLIVGFAGVAQFWLGSSRGSQMKDEYKQ